MILAVWMACGPRQDDAVVVRAPADEAPGEFDLPIPPNPTDTDIPPGTTPAPTTSTTATTTPPGTSSAPVVVCYLGENGDGSLCLDTWPWPSSDPDYVYPDPLYGSAQYAAPTRCLDLEWEDPDTMLAPNFALWELAEAWKGPWAVVMPRTIDVLQSLRDALGPIVVNSGYRSPAYNASVGGATYSRHMYGDGLDLVAVNHDLDTLADACEDEGAHYIGWYESHIHCDWREDPMDPVFYGARSAGPAPAEALSASLSLVDGAWTAPATGWDEGEPLREWTAFSADGSVLERATGARYVPPVDAAAVEVVVGRELTIRTP